MQYKYIVYYPKGKKEPVVDIWTTTGELTHKIYIHKNGLSLQDVSSMGYFVYSPERGKWFLEHYQAGEPANTITDLIKRYRQINRDKKLVHQAWKQTGFPDDRLAQMDTVEEYHVYRKIQADRRKDFFKKLWRSLCHTRG